MFEKFIRGFFGKGGIERRSDEGIVDTTTSIRVDVNDLTTAANAEGLKKMVKILEGNMGKTMPAPESLFAGSAYRIITSNDRFGKTEIYLNDLVFEEEKKLSRMSDLGILIPEKSKLSRLTFTRDSQSYVLSMRSQEQELFHSKGQISELSLHKRKMLFNGRLNVLEDLDQLDVNPAIRDYLIWPFQSTLTLYKKDIASLLNSWRI